MRRTMLLLMAIGIMSLGACGDSDDGGGGGSGASGETKKLTIGWTPPDITGVFKTATDYFEKSAADAKQAGFDIKIISRSPTTHTSFADQLAIIEDFISRNVDVIAISPADTEAVKPAIKQANQAGIPVIMVNLLEPQKDIDIASYIGFDNAEAAKVSAYTVLDYYGGPGVLGTGKKVDAKPDDYLDLKWWEKTYAGVDKSSINAKGAIIEGIAGTFFSQARVDGFNSVIEQYPGVQILAKPLAADWNREKGVKATETYMSRFKPGDLDFIWAASNEMGLGAIQALGNRKRLNSGGADKKPPTGTTSVFTNDVTPESTDAIRAGKLIAETHHGFPEWGWFGTEVAAQLACEEKVEEKIDIRPRTVYQGNADKFYPQPALPKIDWKAIKQDCK